MSDFDYILWQEEANNVIFQDKEIAENAWIHPIPKNKDAYSVDNFNVEFDTMETSISSIPLLQMESYSSIVKLVGRLRNHFAQKGIQILFRGQRNHHNFLQYPSFLRKYSREGILSDYIINVDWLNFFHLSARSELDESINLLAWEATLQHYGIKTRFIDVVDNINKALWFSISDVRKKAYSRNEYSYVFVYGIRANLEVANGVFDGVNVRLIDLRKANPPISLRSHVQDSMLFCDKRVLDVASLSEDVLKTVGNYGRYLFCVIQIPTIVIKEWFGIGEGIYLYSFDTFFPSRTKDVMLDKLITWWESFLELNEKTQTEDFTEFVYTFGSISDLH